MAALRDYGGYALVTGASAGIGAAFSRAFAAMGIPCFLTARREDRLRGLQAELSAQHQVDVQYLACDIAEEAGIARLLQATRELPIGILVNNAGFGHNGPFHTRDPERTAKMVRLNCLAPTVLTRAYLPAMIERKRGAVIIVSSALGLVPGPYETVYGATKAFDLFLGGGLWGELQGSGVDVITICPALTATEFAIVDGRTPEEAQARYKRAASPEYIVDLTLRNLGRKPVVVANEGRFLDLGRRFVSHALGIRILGGILKRSFGDR